MPTTRRRRAQERRVSVRGLDLDVARELLTGGSYFHGAQDLTDDDLRRAWNEHRGYLRRKWQTENGRGSRCFAEWLFEIVPKHGERRVLPGSEFLIEHRANWAKRGILHTLLERPGQEPEIEFLRRHGLLTDSEL
jgi:hypothetical protein